MPRDPSSPTALADLATLPFAEQVVRLRASLDGASTPLREVLAAAASLRDHEPFALVVRTLAERDGLARADVAGEMGALLVALPDTGVQRVLRGLDGLEWPRASHAAWAEIVREFLNAMERRKAGDKGPLQGFINETLGETWEDDESERIEHNELSKRAEDYRLRTVPQGGLVLVAGVDVQHNRFEVVVWAIGRGEEMWVVDYCVIPANPADEREWDDKLDPYLQSTFQHASGQSMRIEAAAVDMMGDFTHQGYNFCRVRERRRVYAVRGDPMPGKPIGGRATLQDVNFRGKTIKRGVKLWYVGTDTAKDLIYGRLKVTQPGPGYVHFSKDLPDAFYEQLTVEARVLVRTASGHVTRWVNVHRRRNEAIDCTVYAMFVSHRLALHTFTDKMWAKLEAAFQPDLFQPADSHPTNKAAAEAAPPAQPEERRHGQTNHRDW